MTSLGSPVSPTSTGPPVTFKALPPRDLPASAAGSKGFTAGHARRKSQPLDVASISASPSARRMSQATTPQRVAMLPSSNLEVALQHAQLIVAGTAAFALVSGTMYSILFKTALSTSISSTPLSRSFFARKSNVFNQYLVKLSWLHTSVIYLTHLFTSPPQFPKFSRFGTFILATAFWAGFTSWFFGPGLGDRIIELTGGACALVLPPDWDITTETLSNILPGGEVVRSSEGNLLHLPSTWCTLRKPLTQISHPEIFSLLATSLSAPSSISSTPSLSALVPRWRRGFDISGHAFLLTLSAILLSRELSPTWRRWAGVDSAARTRAKAGGAVEGRNTGRGWTGIVHGLSGVAGTLLTGVWIFMLGITGMYFHDPPEKFTGLLLGLTAGALLNLAPPSPFTASVSPSDTRRYASRTPMSDENRARRSEVFEEEDEEDVPGLTAVPASAGNKEKVE